MSELHDEQQAISYHAEEATPDLHAAEAAPALEEITGPAIREEHQAGFASTSGEGVFYGNEDYQDQRDEQQYTNLTQAGSHEDFQTRNEDLQNAMMLNRPDNFGGHLSQYQHAEDHPVEEIAYEQDVQHQAHDDSYYSRSLHDAQPHLLHSEQDEALHRPTSAHDDEGHPPDGFDINEESGTAGSSSSSAESSSEEVSPEKVPSKMTAGSRSPSHVGSTNRQNSQEPRGATKGVGMGGSSASQKVYSAADEGTPPLPENFAPEPRSVERNPQHLTPSQSSQHSSLSSSRKYPTPSDIDKYTIDENAEVRLRSEMDRQASGAAGKGQEHQLTGTREAFLQSQHQVHNPISLSVTGLSHMVFPVRGSSTETTDPLLQGIDVLQGTNLGAAEVNTARLATHIEVPDEELEEKVKSILLAGQGVAGPGALHQETASSSSQVGLGGAPRARLYQESVYYRGSTTRVVRPSGNQDRRGGAGGGQQLHMLQEEVDQQEGDASTSMMIGGASSSMHSQRQVQQHNTTHDQHQADQERQAILQKDQAGKQLLAAFDEATRKLETLSVCSDPIPDISPVLESPDIHEQDNQDDLRSDTSSLDELELFGEDVEDPRRYLDSVDVVELQRALKHACSLLHTKDAEICELKAYSEDLSTKFAEKTDLFARKLAEAEERERVLLRRVQEQEESMRDRIARLQIETEELRRDLSKEVAVSPENDQLLSEAVVGGGRSGEGGEHIVEGGDGEGRDAVDPQSWNRLAQWVQKANLQEAKKLQRTVDMLSAYWEKQSLVIQILRAWVGYVGPFRAMKAFFVDFGAVEAVWETLDKYYQRAKRESDAQSNSPSHEQELGALIVMRLCCELLWHMSYTTDAIRRFPQQPIERLVEMCGFSLLADDPESVRGLLGTIANLMSQAEDAQATFLDVGGIQFLKMLDERYPSFTSLVANAAAGNGLPPAINNGRNKLSSTKARSIVGTHMMQCLYLVSLTFRHRVFQEKGHLLAEGRPEQWAVWCADLFKSLAIVHGGGEVRVGGEPHSQPSLDGDHPFTRRQEEQALQDDLQKDFLVAQGNERRLEESGARQKDGDRSIPLVENVADNGRQRLSPLQDDFDDSFSKGLSLQEAPHTANLDI
ncbi:unnamed protein product [Amoebophrya sp. A25]|nr:unnamed protein product [Amoebophrya sp. A25]|eukprot:GSA25T00012694001.1